MTTPADGIAITSAAALPTQESAVAPAAVTLLAQLATDHPTLAARAARERLLAAAWLAGYRSPRTRRAYALDLSAWLDWLHGLQVDVLAARRVHVDPAQRHPSGAAGRPRGLPSDPLTGRGGASPCHEPLDSVSMLG